MMASRHSVSEVVCVLVIKGIDEAIALSFPKSVALPVSISLTLKLIIWIHYVIIYIFSLVVLIT